MKTTRFHSCLRLIVLPLLISGLFNCTQRNVLNKPPEIIEFVRIDSGCSTSLSLSEIFTAKKYKPIFSPNPDIQLVYQPDSNIIILTPNNSFSGLTMINFTNQKKDLCLPIIVKQKNLVTFSYKPPKPVREIFVMGNFNDWNRSSLPMSDEDSDGIFTRDVWLDDGLYEYQFVVDQNEIYDPANPEKTDNGFGYFNSVLRVTAPLADYAANLYILPTRQNDTITLAVDCLGDTSDIRYFVLLDNHLCPPKSYHHKNKQLQIYLNSLENTIGMHILRATAQYKNQPGNVITIYLKNGKPLDNNTFIWNDACLYAIMTDRFKNGNSGNDRPVVHPHLASQANFHGGDFDGIRQTIESGYFDDLGINTLWISPVNKTTDSAYQEWPEPNNYFSGYHGYWPTDAKQTDSRFGSLQELKKLVEVAHRHNIKVLLDFVSNHVHIEHPYFKEHREWFGQLELPDGSLNIRRWDEYRLTTWFDTFLPSFDYEGSHEALQTMTGNAVWWLKQTDADGFRHDATKHVPHAFWQTLTSKINKRINPHRNLDIFQIGECFGSNELIKSYVNNGMLESQFNFNQFFTARRVFVEPTGDFRDLELAIKKALEVYGYNHLMGNLMDSHDQVRIMAFLDGDLTLSDNGTMRAWQEPPITVDNPLTYRKELVFFGYLLTVPGIPVIDYGDEFGLTGANDPDNRRMMRFGEELSDLEREQLQQVSNLIQLRNMHPALRRGDYLPLKAEKDIFIYSRGDANERLIIALNKSPDIQNPIIFLPDWLKGQSLRSLTNNNTWPIDYNTVKVSLAGYSVDIFTINP